MSRATLTLPNELLSELMGLVQARSKTEAVVLAIKDAIRLRKLEKIRSMAGKMEFAASAEELRHGDPRPG